MPRNGYVTNTRLATELKGLEKRIKSTILESEEKVLGEIKDMREEFSVHQSSHRRINEEIQDHDRRIKKLETASA